MIKFNNLKKIMAILNVGVVLAGCSQVTQKESEDKSKNYTSQSSYEDMIYDLYESKEKLSEELIQMVNSEDIGIIDYIENYVDISLTDDFYDINNDTCTYFTNLSDSQRKIIYDFSRYYLEYIKSVESNDQDTTKRLMVKLLNKAREFGHISYALSKSLPSLLNVDKNDTELFGLNNLNINEIKDNDFNDYIVSLYDGNRNILSKYDKLSIDKIELDAIDREIAELLLFMHLYMKYNNNPLNIIYNDNGNFTLMTQEEIFNNDQINYYVRFEKNKWFLFINDNFFYEIKSDKILKYLDTLYKITGKLSYTSKEIKSIEINNNSNLENYWWPIGSSETEKINGVEFASGKPEETFLDSKGRYINGRNGSGVTNIIASKSGVVIYPKDDSQILYENHTRKGGYGNYVIIKHDDGNYTLYSHLHPDSITVFAGDQVLQGQVIGQMGSSGDALDTYLEFEIRVKENKKENCANIFDYVDIDNPRSCNNDKKLLLKR